MRGKVLLQLQGGPGPACLMCPSSVALRPATANRNRTPPLVQRVEERLQETKLVACWISYPMPFTITVIMPSLPRPRV